MHSNRDGLFIFLALLLVITIWIMPAVIVALVTFFAFGISAAKSIGCGILAKIAMMAFSN